MNSKIVVFTCCALALVLGFGNSFAAAQDATAKVAICNAIKALTQTVEFKDMQTATTNGGKAFQDEFNKRKAALAQTQTDMQIYKPDSKEFKDKNDALLQKTIEFEAWANITQREELRTQKTHTKMLFDKMDATIAKLCQAKGITLVLSDQHADLTDADMEKLDPNQLSVELARRTVLYNDPKLDITADVVIAMDKDYAARH